MIDSRVMAFAMRTVEAHETFDLCITLADLTILWGPGTLSYYPFPGPEAVLPGSWLRGIAFRNGVIYKPTAESSDMHWKAGAIDDIRDGVAFELDVQKKMTIGTILVKRNCPTEPGPYNTVPRTNISNEFKELGTWPERWNLREQQVGLQGGQFLNATFNATWIKSDSRTRKQKGLEEVNLDFLNQPWGLLLSVCTGVAQRVALREVVAEVMSQMTDGWLEKPLEWQTLMSMGEGLFEELKKPTFSTWVKKLDIVAQHALIRSISYVLHKMCWTEVNRAGKLVVACPQNGNSDACIHVPLKGSRGFTWLFRDTERSATFACLTNTCFVVAPWFDDCQDRPHPQWQNQVPGLVTSVCQYQWLGADDWAKSPQSDLRNEGVYWISTGEDRRRVTAKTSSDSPARLTISESTIHWRFFRRAWERVERIRKDTLIELRERSLMTEDCAQDVVIVRD